jgi:hypothetical protein
LPTTTPTQVPTQVPTSTPTQAPTQVPTQVPTSTPTQAPTQVPTQVPTSVPTRADQDDCDHVPWPWEKHHVPGPGEDPFNCHKLCKAFYAAQNQCRFSHCQKCEDKDGQCKQVIDAATMAAAGLPDIEEKVKKWSEKANRCCSKYVDAGQGATSDTMCPKFGTTGHEILDAWCKHWEPEYSYDWDNCRYFKKRSLCSSNEDCVKETRGAKPCCSRGRCMPLTRCADGSYRCQCPAPYYPPVIPPRPTYYPTGIPYIPTTGVTIYPRPTGTTYPYPTSTTYPHPTGTSYIPTQFPTSVPTKCRNDAECGKCRMCQRGRCVPKSCPAGLFLNPITCQCGPKPTPTLMPTYLIPTYKPTLKPTSKPSYIPTHKPTSKPTYVPTYKPTFKPTSKPTFRPTRAPAYRPIPRPTPRPASSPTSTPTRPRGG